MLSKVGTVWVIPYMYIYYTKYFGTLTFPVRWRLKIQVPLSESKIQKGKYLQKPLVLFEK
jgi:hypothetical protein